MVVVVGGESLEFCNTSGGDQKNFAHTVGGITKNLQNLKNFQRPLPVKNDTSLKAFLSFVHQMQELFGNIRYTEH